MSSHWDGLVVFVCEAPTLLHVVYMSEGQSMPNTSALLTLYLSSLLPFKSKINMRFKVVELVTGTTHLTQYC